MSTSASRSLIAPDPDRPGPVADLQPFPYDSTPAGSPAHGLGNDDPTAGLREEARSRSAADDAAREAQARAQGRQEGQAEARTVFEPRLAQERVQLAEALAQFTRDRAAYF